MAVRTLIAVVVLCLGLTGLVSECAWAQTGLVAAYNFDEGSGSTVVDASGNDNTGTVSGATWTTAGRNGGALVFNGTSARVTVANSASLGLTSAMTLEAWVYPTSPPTSWRAILAKNNDGYYLMASSSQGNRPVVGGTWVAGNQNTVGLARLPSNTWTHLAGTFDGATVRLYVNGALVASRAQTTALVPTTGTLQIGGDAHGEFFAGRIDDVRIYHRALSLAEIQTDMTTPVGGAPGPDTIPPTVATTSPTAGATYAANASPLTVAGTAADNVGVTQVTWTNDRGGSGTAAGTSSWTAPGIALQPGTNVLVFTARDASANTGTKTLTVSFDATAPTIGISTPTSGSTYVTNASLVTLGGSAADNVAVTQVAWTNNRGGSGTASGTTSWTASGIGLQAGTNILTVTARDAAGNTATATLTVTYTAADTTAPGVTITAPTSGATYATNTTPVTVAGTATDNVGVTQVTWSNDRGGSGTASGTSNWAASGIGLQAGTNILTVTARDAAGNTATATLTVTYTAADTTAPGVTITAPTSGATYATNTTPVTVAGTATDNVGVTQVTWSNDRGGSGTASGTSNWAATGIALQAGTNILTITARDAAGNTGAKTLAVSFDGTAPSVSLTAPPSGATLSGSTTLTATAADNIGVVGVQFLLDGAPLGAEQTGPYSLSWNTASATNGPHTLSARARDSAGNTALAPNISVTVSNTQQPTGLVAAYNFDEGSGSTVVDASGNGNTGTVSGATWTTAGRNGGALVFNGTSARVTVANSASLGLTSAMTLEAWVYPTIPPSSWRAVLAKNNDGYYLMGSSDQGNRPVVGGTWVAGNQNTVGLAALPSNTWTHLAGTFDGATVRLYVNGALVASQAQTTALVPTTGTLQIGGDAYGEFFAGRIDDVRIYNRALSLAEIQTDMTTPVGGAPGPGPMPPTVAITAPAGGAAVSGTVTVTADASDNTGVAGVQFFVNGNPIGPEDTTGPYAVQWNTAGVPAGQYTLTARASDVDGNTTVSAPVTVTVSTTGPDPTPPTVAITAPAGGATVSGTVTVTADASDNTGVAGVQFYVNGNPIGPEDTTGPYAVQWNTAGVPAGQYTLTARASDVDGNTTVSAPVTVTVASANVAQVGSWSGPSDWDPLVAVHMTLTPTGKVLAWDGQEQAPSSARLWDPATGEFLSVPNGPNIFCSGHCVIPDGRVLVAGGHAISFVGIRNLTLFDPASSTWASGRPMAYPRWYPTTTVLPDGRVLVVSGSSDCATCIVEIPEIYNPATNTWQPLTGANLALDLYPHMFVLPDGRILAAANAEEPMISQVLDINAQTWTPVGSSTALNGGSSVMYRPGVVMKSGLGRNPDHPSAPAVATTYVLDMNQPSPTWRQTASMAFARTQHNLTLLPDGTVLATGGGGVSDVFDLGAAVLPVELWSPSTETWTTLASMQVPRLYHSTALLLPDGRVLSAGGGRFGVDQHSAEIFSPPYLFKGTRPTITSAPTQITNGASFTVQTPDAAAISSVSLIRIGSVTHSINMDQRFLNLTFQAGAGALTVQAPANANTAPPGYYMLFILNASGVPSVAPIIRVQ